MGVDALLLGEKTKVVSCPAYKVCVPVGWILFFLFFYIIGKSKSPLKHLGKRAICCLLVSSHGRQSSKCIKLNNSGLSEIAIQKSEKS